MSWKVIDRIKPATGAGAAPVLSDAVREKIRSFFGRYETKRAVLLPALHIVQDTLGYIPEPAMAELGELLEIPPSQVMDTVSFYTHFWRHPRGRKVVTVCRSLTCELLGGRELLASLKRRLDIDEHETTADGAFSLATEECLAGCDHGPCMLVNERLHKCVKVDDVEKILADAESDKLDMPRSDLFDAPGRDGSDGEPSDREPVLESTSDVREMREAD